MQTTSASRFAWETAFRRLGSKPWMKPSTFAVGFYLATWADGDGSKIFPGVERAAADLGVSESTVKRAMDTLRRKGWITLTAPANKRRGLATVHRLSFPGDRRPPQDQGSPMTPHQSITSTSSHSMEDSVAKEMQEMETRRLRDQAAAEERLRRELTR